jgi:hypothetical protein
VVWLPVIWANSCQVVAAPATPRCGVSGFATYADLGSLREIVLSLIDDQLNPNIKLE